MTLPNLVNPPVAVWPLISRSLAVADTAFPPKQNTSQPLLLTMSNKKAYMLGTMFYRGLELLLIIRGKGLLDVCCASRGSAQVLGTSFGPLVAGPAHSVKGSAVWAPVP